MSKRSLSWSLYLNYLVHGIGLIILTQNMQALSQQWHSPLATVSYVFSGVGIGRILAYFLFGRLSDKFGRKVFVNVGMVSYLIFFLGMAVVTNLQVAYGLAILAGVANSALDSGTYATFIEMGGAPGSGQHLGQGLRVGGGVSFTPVSCRHRSHQRLVRLVVSARQCDSGRQSHLLEPADLPAT